MAIMIKNDFVRSGLYGHDGQLVRYFQDEQELYSLLHTYYEDLERDYPLMMMLQHLGDCTQINTWPDAVVLKVFPEGVHPSAERLMMPVRSLSPEILTLDKSGLDRSGWDCGLGARGYVFYAQARHEFWQYCWVLRFTLLSKELSTEWTLEDKRQQYEPEGLLQRWLLECQRLGISVYPKQVSSKTWDLMLRIEPGTIEPGIGTELGSVFEQYRLRKAWRQFAYRTIQRISMTGNHGKALYSLSNWSLIEPRVWELPGSAQIRTTPHTASVNFPSIHFSLEDLHLPATIHTRALADLLYNGATS
ncbi:MAG: hypothetical protein K2X01_05610 [Cyanobacteria bacterium]|nr:hypothetical protein [Cyanobacteriota bacterium]